MDFIRITSALILTLHFTQVSSKSKKHKYSSSEESIENLLYYRDCLDDKETTTEEPTTTTTVTTTTENPMPRLRMLNQQSECLHPKMCCSLSCGNDCDSSKSSLIARMPSETPHLPYTPVQPIQDGQGFSDMGFSLPLFTARKRNKMRHKLKKRLPPLEIDSPDVPMSGRRSMGTKEKIKSLISHDNDLRRILKELVTVTMQKVNLLDMMNTQTTTEAVGVDLHYYDD